MRLSFVTCAVLLIVCAISVSSVLADDIAIGDSKDKVISILGSPRSVMKAGKKEILVYNDGSVTLVDGKVSESKIKRAIPKKQEEQTSAPSPAVQPTGSIKLNYAQRTNAPFLLPLATVPSMEFKDVDLEAFFSKWTAFDHESFKSSGFSHVTLPFRFESADNQGGPEEANAFSFLLSNAIDWTPGCYCARHAYFVYKRTGADVIRAGRTFDTNLISGLCERWTATHAIAGKLKREKQGYSATVLVFDSKGKIVHEKTFPGPSDYFELLGAVTCDVMRFFKYEPQPAMVKHLSAKRCKDFKSISDLGKAAFIEERSPEEFALYEGILKRDPDFAEVRYWYYNQKAWYDNSWSEYRYQLGVSLRSYLTESALSDFRPSECRDKALATNYAAWIDEAAQLAGADHPLVLQLRLDNGSKDAEILNRALNCAFQYPNGFQLIRTILRRLADERQTLSDYDLVASMACAALRSNYNFGSPEDATLTLYTYLQKSMSNLGYCDVAAKFSVALMQIHMKRGSKNEAGVDAMNVAEEFRMIGRYEDSFNISIAALELLDKGSSAWTDAGIRSCLMCAYCGRKDVFTELTHRRRDLLDDPIVVRCQSILDHNGRNLPPWDQPSENGRTFWYIGNMLALSVQGDLVDKTAHLDKVGDDLMRRLQYCPSDRELWLLFDLLDRARPQPAAASFYQSLEWLHPEDKWAQHAVRDFRQRTKNPIVSSPDEMLKTFADFKPLRWPSLEEQPTVHVTHGLIYADASPFAVAAAVQQLLHQNKNEKAKELALRYVHYTAEVIWHPQSVAYAYHLYHLTERTGSGGWLPLTGLYPSDSDRQASGYLADAGRGVDYFSRDVGP